MSRQADVCAWRHGCIHSVCVLRRRADTATVEVALESGVRVIQGIVLLPVLERTLSTPPVVYALTAKYHVPLGRLLTE